MVGLLPRIITINGRILKHDVVLEKRDNNWALYNVILSIVIFVIYYKSGLTLKTIHLTNVCDI